MADKLDYKTDTLEDGTSITSFKLAAGSKLQLGTETVEIATDSDIFFIRKTLSRDSLVDLLVSTGQASVNAANLPYVEERDGVEVQVTYGGRGQRIETVIEKDDEEDAKPAKRSKKAATPAE